MATKMAASWTEKFFVAKYVFALWNYNGKYFRPSPKQFGFPLFYLMIEKKCRVIDLEDDDCV